jgi:hypothetical protein
MYWDDKPQYQEDDSLLTDKAKSPIVSVYAHVFLFHQRRQKWDK